MSEVQQKLPPLLAIVGQTAVGKTAFSIELAKRLNGEVVSADSRQVYRRMDIGTAKPSLEERDGVPHHLIDVVEPDEDFSLGLYQDLAMAAIADITARGRFPLLVGGTGQYLAAVLQGWTIPRVAPQPELRAQLEAEAQEHGVEALHARLVQIDPEAAAGIHATNVRRVIRALEVYEVTGQPISAQQTHQAPAYQIQSLWLTLPASVLYARIDRRVDMMMSQGLLDEVTTLHQQGYAWDLTSMSGLGYREFQPYFEGEATLEEAVLRLKYNTHGFARRQPNWFRRLPSLQQVAADKLNVDAMAWLIQQQLA